MRNLDKNIQELLYRYDCVIIPEFGGFVSNYKPAAIDKQRNIISPPGKNISFNKNLLNNDGLLASSLSHSGNISFEDANAIIKETVESYFATLNNGQRICFDKVGILFFDKDKNLQFNPARETNYLMDSFGFEPMYAPVINRVSEEAKIEKPSEVKVKTLPIAEKPAAKSEKPKRIEEKVVPLKPATEIKKRPLRKFYRAAAVIALPLVAYTSFITLNNDFKNPAELTIADINPFKKSISPIYTPSDKELTIFSDINQSEKLPEAGIFSYSLISGLPDADGVTINFNKAEVSLSSREAPVETPKVTGPYHIIAGCFSSEENANKLIRKYNSSAAFKAEILDYHKGLYRVKIQSFTDYSTALETLERLKKNQLPAAWMVKKY